MFIDDIHAAKTEKLKATVHRSPKLQMASLKNKLCLSLLFYEEVDKHSGKFLFL